MDLPRPKERSVKTLVRMIALLLCMSGGAACGDVRLPQTAAPSPIPPVPLPPPAPAPDYRTEWTLTETLSDVGPGFSCQERSSGWEPFLGRSTERRLTIDRWPTTITVWDHLSNYSMGGLYDMEGVLSGREFTIRTRPTSGSKKCSDQLIIVFQTYLQVQGRFSEDDRRLTAHFREVEVVNGEERAPVEWDWTAVRLERP